MEQINIVNLIKEKLKQQNINVSDGSVISDILINPLSYAMASYQVEHDAIIARQAVTDLSALTEEQLDAVAANFLLYRQAGSKAFGYIRCYFSSPRPFSMQKGTIFTTVGSNLEFETLSNFSLSKLQMQLNSAEYPMYDTGNIFIQAKTAGLGNLDPGTLFTIQSSTQMTPVKITNIFAFSGGSAKETNTTFFNRVKNTVLNNSLASPSSIKNSIIDLIDSVVDVEVVGAGHDKMIRDLTNTYEHISTYRSEDYLHVYSGLHSGVYDKKHVAYAGYFSDTDETDVVAIPDPGAWSQEFSNNMYQGIYALGDAEYTENSERYFIRELFDYPTDIIDPLTVLMTSGMWQFHDGLRPSQDLYYTDEFGIDVDNGRLRLGKTLNSEGLTADVSILLSELESIQSGIINGDPNASDQLGLLIGSSYFNNLSPIIHKQIDTHTGIEINLTVSTTDDTEDGEMCYITVLRDSVVYKPHDGYGLAWRKQPAYLIRLHKSLLGTYTYEAPFDITADTETFTEEYQIALSASWTGTGIPSTYWKYNVYLVDNDILQDDVWVGREQLWDQTNGTNQFLQAAKVWIEQDLVYNIKYKVYPKLGFQAWVWADGVDYDENTHLVIDRGTTYPPYIPVSGDKRTTITGVDVLESYRNHFGIAVAETRNCEWYIDNLTVRSFEETFPMHLFKFHMSGQYFDAAGSAVLNYYGLGYDPTKYAEDGSGHSKVRAVVYNQTNSEWEEIDTNEYTIDDVAGSPTLAKLTKTVTGLTNYLDANNYLYIAATAINSGSDFPDDTEHNLRTYYVEVNNVAEVLSHRGNAWDIYVHDPVNILEGSVVGSISGNSLHLQSLVGIDTHISLILSVNDINSGVTFSTDSYTIVNNNEGTSFSKNSNYTIVFDLGDLEGAIVEVRYLYWSMGDSVDQFVNDASRRYPSADQLVKVMPPTIVDIAKLEFTGSLSADEAKELIVSYVNSLTTTTFSKSNLIEALYAGGATYVNVNMNINAIEYDTVFVKTTRRMESTYTIPVDNISRFYCHSDYLNGVARV